MLQSKPAEPVFRLTRYSLSDFALSRVALFRPLGSGASNKRQTVAEMMSSGGGDAVADQIELNDPEVGRLRVGFTSLPLGAREEDLLLVLLALAAMAGTKAAPAKVKGGPRAKADDRADGLALFSRAVEVLETKGDSLKGSVFIIRAPQALLMRAWRGRVGTGDDYADLEDSLRRLQTISYYAQGLNGNRRWSHGSSGLLSYEMQEDDPDATEAWKAGRTRKRPSQSVRITLSERLARVILGWDMVDGPKKRGRPPKASNARGRFYVRVNLDERFQLSSDTARLLHRYLSGIVREPRGRSTQVADGLRLATIIRALWGPHPEPKLDAKLARKNPAAAQEKLRDDLKAHQQEIRHRREGLRAAFTQVNRLEGWCIADKPDDPFDDPAVIVTRTGTKKRKSTPLQEVLGLDEGPKIDAASA